MEFVYVHTCVCVCVSADNDSRCVSSRQTLATKFTDNFQNINFRTEATLTFHRVALQTSALVTQRFTQSG